MDYPYWSDRDEFTRQSELLQTLHDEQYKGYGAQKRTRLSLVELADRQRKELVACIYLAGGRIDNKACLGSRHVGMLFSSLPTDYVKAIAPAFHSDHDEIFFCTDGQVVLESATSIDKDAALRTVVLSPGDYFIARAKCPHRVSLAPVRLLLEEGGGQLRVRDQTEIADTHAGFFAVKSGLLTGKGLFEKMSDWPHACRDHPLVAGWLKDQELMEKIRADRTLCELLSIPPSHRTA